jgi:hypothetical protein
MKIYSVPRRYAPEIKAAVESVMRSVRYDMDARRLGGTTHVDTDESLTGSISVSIVEQPATAAFPFGAPYKAVDTDKGESFRGENEARAQAAGL